MKENIQEQFYKDLEKAIKDEKKIIIFNECEDRTLGKSKFALEFGKQLEKYLKKLKEDKQ